MSEKKLQAMSTSNKSKKKPFGPLNGKTTQLRAIISSSQANNNQEEKGAAVKGIDERINSGGSISYRARVRVKGHVPITKTFSLLTLAKKRKKTKEVAIEKGHYFDKHEAQKHTMDEAIERYIQTVLPKKSKNAHNVKQHLLWWKKHLKPLTLDAVKPSLNAEKRNPLLSEPNDYGRRWPLVICLVFLICLQLRLKDGDGCLKTLFANYLSPKWLMDAFAF